MKKLALAMIAFRWLSAQTSPCDLNRDGATNVVDVQLAINQALGLASCTTGNLAHDGCTAYDVQLVMTAALGGACLIPQGMTLGNSDAIAIYEADGVNRAGLPVTLGRAFASGEFALCLQPVLGGVPISSYQVDVKNRWPDNSVKFAIVSFIIPNLQSNGALLVSFQPSSSCNNSAFLSQSQMLNFNSGNWGAEMDVTAAGTTVKPKASTMLARTDPGANSFGDCKNDYWLQGPVVTAVIVQDCTATTAFDFGWTWNGTSMSGLTTGNCNGAPQCAASLHPWFILYFYPGSNAVRADMILENDWTDRAQNQAIQVDYYTGSTPTKALGYDGIPRITPANDITFTANSDSIVSAGGANFTSADVGSSIAVGTNAPVTGYTQVDTTICAVTDATHARLCAPPPGSGTGTAAINIWYWQQMYRKTFWTGTGNPGNYLIDHNWAYLVSTGMVPPYDTTKSASPDSSVLSNTDNCNAGPSTGTDFTCMAQYSVTGAGAGPQTWSDMGDRGGHGRLDQAFSQYDHDPTPLSRETLLYLTNMGTCGIANGPCAKAWLMNTGQHGARDAAIAANLIATAATGGSGIFNNSGNIPFHLRESQTALGSGGGHYFCPAMAAGQYASTGAGSGNNVSNNSTVCGGSSDTPFGRPFSRYYNPFSVTTNPIGVPSGAQSPYNNQGQWTPEAIRWLEWTYNAYLITGDYYYGLDTQMNGAWAAGAINYASTDWGSNSFFAFMNSSQGALRQPAGLLDAVQKAWAVSPDASSEQQYFDSIIASNAEVYEGMMGITGTSLTPGSTNPSCSGAVNVDAINRWDWGRCVVVSLCGANEPQGASSCAPITPALHNYGWSQVSAANLNSNANGFGLTVEYAIPGATTQLIDWNPNSSVAPVGTTLYITGAQSPWTAINGMHTILAASTTTSHCGPPATTCNVYTIDANTTANTAGTVSGSVAGYWGWTSPITTATIGSNSTLTAASSGFGFGVVIYGCIDQAGGTSPNWSKLNGFRSLVSLSGTGFQISGGFNSTGFPAFAQTGCFFTQYGLKAAMFTDFVQGWMEGLLGISINEMAGKGLKYFGTVAQEANYRLIEKLLDSNSNPYLLGMNFQPMKSPNGNASLNYGSSTNPFLSSWSAVAAALAPACLTANSFWDPADTTARPALPDGCNAGNNPCLDHSYSLVNRAMAAFLPGITDLTDGGLSGTTAWNWVNANFPYFNMARSGDTSCADHGLNDTQIKFAFAPR